MPKLSQALIRDLAVNATPPPITEAGKASLLEVFYSLAAKSRAQGLNDDVWMVILACTLMAANLPSAWDTVWLYCRQTSGDDQDSLYRRASLLREAGLKSMALVGLPRVITGLTSFHKSIVTTTPKIAQALAKEQARRKPTRDTIEVTNGQGEDRFLSEHRPFDRTIAKNMAALHPDLPVYIICANYGLLISDPPNTFHPAPVGRINQSILALATMRASGGLGIQMTSHAFGLMKVGKESEAGEFDGVAEVGEGVTWLTSDEGCRWILNAVDRILWAVGGEGREGVNWAKL